MLPSFIVSIHFTEIFLEIIINRINLFKSSINQIIVNLRNRSNCNAQISIQNESESANLSVCQWGEVSHEDTSASFIRKVTKSYSIIRHTFSLSALKRKYYQLRKRACKCNLTKEINKNQLYSSLFLHMLVFALYIMINTCTYRTEIEIPKVIEVANDTGQPDYITNNTDRRQNMK